MYIIFLNIVILVLMIPGLMASVIFNQRSSSSFHLKKVDTLFSFGDSYTTEYLDLPTMTYPDFNNVSSTNGANWIHYFTEAEHLKNWDLAYNSAPIENSLVHQNSNRQITELFPQYFLQNDTTYCKDKTLYSIWVGINDIGLLVNNQTTSLTSLMHRYRQLISYLYHHDARNIVLINIPPIDKSPKWAPHDTATRIHDLVEEYNRKLYKMAKSIAKQHRHARIFFIDAWSIFNHMLNHPDMYGFRNVTGYCPDWRHPEEHGCLPIENYFWLNDLHPTTKVHFHFASQVRRFLSEA
ncbi:unnamed protein product [Absidia cylindrospora]